jgi:hypothetical protein
VRQGQRQHLKLLCACAGIAFACGAVAQDAPYGASDSGARPPDAAPDASEPAALPAAVRADGRPNTLSNDDVLEMARAGFAESTILAAFAANDTDFDVSTRALLGLKSAGVSEAVIEAMLTTEAANRRAASTKKPAGDGATSPADIARLSAMITQLAAKQDAAAAAQRPTEPPKNADPAPHAWVLNSGDRTPLPPTIAQVAFSDDRGAQRMKTLQSVANKALVFVNPAVGGIATTLGGLFHPANQARTAIWALSGPAAPRDIGASPMFEVEFGHIPGVDPDEYQPAVVRLVPTKDNYRLIAAAKTLGARQDNAPPDGPIIEEPVVTELTQLGRGQYRLATATLLTGEYALVLRPIEKDDKGRRKRRKSEASLGDLLGGTTQILYFTWDFGVSR